MNEWKVSGSRELSAQIQRSRNVIVWDKVDWFFWKAACLWISDGGEERGFNMGVFHISLKALRI